VNWRVIISPHAQRELDALDMPERARIARALARLAASPYRAPNVKALRGGGYRLRVGNYRILYEIRDQQLIVLVLRVAHRREVYRR
jgi:mRNA interferase RelE/StbE